MTTPATRTTTNYGGQPAFEVLRDKDGRKKRDKPAPVVVDEPNPNAETDRHGTLDAPRERKRKGGSTRQTSLAIDTKLDEHLSRYFLRVRGKRFGTKSEIINAALAEYLHLHDGPGGRDA